MMFMPTRVRPPAQYEPADQDFFVHRSIILADKTEEAFLVRIRRWLELADCALANESRFQVAINRLSDNVGCVKHVLGTLQPALWQLDF